MVMRPPSVTDSRGIFQRSEPDELRVEGQESLLDAASSFDGLFRVGQHLRIEGEAKGVIQCDGTLTIAEGATVSATVVATNIVIAGTLSGDITCRERLLILPSGRVSGTVSTDSLVIQEGALYEGELHMRTTPADTGPQPPAARAAPAGRRGSAGNGRATDAVPADEN